jgi:nucleoside diphosphate kinase
MSNPKSQLSGRSVPFDELTVMPDKARAYAEETWAREAWEDLAEASGDPLEFMHRQALLIIKPDAIAARATSAILDSVLAQRFRPAAVRTVAFHRHLMRSLWHYKFNVATPERLAIQDMLQSSCPNILVMLRDEEPDPSIPAAVRLTAFKGPSALARRRSEHLRSQLGVQNRLLSFVHTTDEPADLVRELAIFFPRAERRALIAEVLERNDRRVALDGAVRALEAAMAPHDLRLDTALIRIYELASEQAASDGCGDWARLAALCASPASAHAAGWTALWPLLEPRLTLFDRWDVIALGAHLVQEDLAGTLPRLGDADAALWHTRLAKQR